MHKVALITGAARRIGAGIAERLHRAGFNVALQCRDSLAEAAVLAARCNVTRPGSALVIPMALEDPTAPTRLLDATVHAFGRLDLLVNNASRYAPTPLGTISHGDWDHLLAVNLAAPFFLAQAGMPHLRATCGSIINISDIYGERPRREHSVYSITKAGLLMLTRSLAVELAPEIRVNAIAPGAILWPEHGAIDRQSVIEATPLHRLGAIDDIAQAVEYLVAADFVTGQILVVDGGRLATV